MDTPQPALSPGDEVLLHNHRAHPRWRGDYTREQGYLLGLLVGDGVLKRDKAVLSVWDAAGPGIRGVKEEALRCARALPHRADFKGWIEVKGRAESRLSLAALRDLALECGMSAGRKVITPKLEQGSSRFLPGIPPRAFRCRRVGPGWTGQGRQRPAGSVRSCPPGSGPADAAAAGNRLHDLRRPRGRHQAPARRQGRAQELSRSAASTNSSSAATTWPSSTRLSDSRTMRKPRSSRACWPRIRGGSTASDLWPASCR